MTGKNADYHSLPYRAVTHFSVESAGTFDRDADLKIWVSGNDKPIEKDLSSDVDIKLLLRTMAEHIL
ncbi:MAG: PH domain-containing protein [Anaerolineae bacterium]